MPGTNDELLTQLTHVKYPNCKDDSGQVVENTIFHFTYNKLYRCISILINKQDSNKHTMVNFFKNTNFSLFDLQNFTLCKYLKRIIITISI